MIYFRFCGTEGYFRRLFKRRNNKGGIYYGLSFLVFLHHVLIADIIYELTTNLFVPWDLASFNYYVKKDFSYNNLL